MAHLSGLGEHRIALSFYLRVHQRHLREYREDALATLDVAENIAFTLQELGDHEAARAVDADLLPRFERAAGKGCLGFETHAQASGESPQGPWLRCRSGRNLGRIPKF
ncbi:tetratricopeptide repeat protein [Streptomyces sp. NBC_01285]|uniref:tetratricopeptide repeat protein n=1 Tax=Streptomyces sp. NBC_01285 TaxID=2903813 RepID=UPI002255EFE9|nr:tetratricopeptide repeat protein [Streptomyces sp. NBC_01285]MCX4774150.1 tetratricopeptide repeat protein [Streptomyces sp. NBC_01285]